jgi:hypothetical protein
MSRENKNILLRVGADIELSDDVMDGDGAAWCGGDEIVGFDLCAILLQDLMDEVFGHLTAGRSGPAFSETRNFGGIGISLLRVEGVVQGGRCSRDRGRDKRGGDQAKSNENIDSLHPDVGYSKPWWGHNKRQAITIIRCPFAAKS